MSRYIPTVNTVTKQLSVGVFLLFLVVLPLVLRRGVLVLLVLRHEVVHVTLGLCELHFVHALPGVPVQEGLPAEHGGELFADALEEFLDGRAVPDEGGTHLEPARGNVTDGGLDVVGDPLDEIGAILVLHV